VYEKGKHKTLFDIGQLLFLVQRRFQNLPEEPVELFRIPNETLKDSNE
jgi:hypothetical protein